MVWRKTFKPDWEALIRALLIDGVAATAWVYLICVFVIHINCFVVGTYLFNCFFYLVLWTSRRLASWQ
jgi:hypothetical protein